MVNACDNRSKIVGLEALRAENWALYQDIFDAQYAQSYANPSFACARFGQKMGRLLSFLYTEIRAMIPYAFEQDLEEMVIRMELFVEIYYAFSHAESEKELMALPEEAAIPDLEDIKNTLYWFVSDYSETSTGRSVRSLVDADCDFAVRIVMDSDLRGFEIFVSLWGVCVVRCGEDGSILKFIARGTHSTDGRHIYGRVSHWVCKGTYQSWQERNCGLALYVRI